MQTRILKIKQKSNDRVEVTCSHPDKTFLCDKSDLDDPNAFRNAFWKHVQGRPSGPCFDRASRYYPKTKGQLQARWNALLEAANG